MIPRSRSEVMRMPANDLDVVMAELGLPPFLPTSTVGLRRQECWKAVQRAAIRAQIPAVSSSRRAGWLTPKRPATYVRSPRNNNSLVRSLFVAALTGITEDDAQAISRAHFEAEGRYTMNHEKAVRTAFRVIHGIGWGIDVLPSGLVRVYR